MRLREHEAIVSRPNALQVDPRKLKTTEGLNLRDLTTPQAREALDILKEQIREKGGVIKPLEVRMVGGECHIVDGHRRHKAVMELIAEGMEILSVPAMQEPKSVNDAERILNIFLHNSGEPLSMLEKAEGVRRLLNMGWQKEKIAARLGYKTPVTIANFELLLAAPEKVLNAVRQGDIAPSTAVELVRHHGDGAGAKLVDITEAAAKRGKARASVRDVVRQEAPPPRGNASPATIEQRNAERLAEHTQKAQRDVTHVTEAIELLYDMVQRGVKPATIAEGFGDDRAADLASRWLDEFVAVLRQRGESAA